MALAAFYSCYAAFYCKSWEGLLLPVVSKCIYSWNLYNMKKAPSVDVCFLVKFFSVCLWPHLIYWFFCKICIKLVVFLVISKVSDRVRSVRYQWGSCSVNYDLLLLLWIVVLASSRAAHTRPGKFCWQSVFSWYKKEICWEEVMS